MGNDLIWVTSGARSVTAALARVLAVWVMLAASGCAWLDAQQRQIIYRPTPAADVAHTGLREGDQVFFLSAGQAESPARITLWWLPHADSQAPTVLYLHGTFRNLQGNLQKIEALRNSGFAVLAVDYRGWGQSTAITPSEQTILQDAGVAWAELVRREPRPSRRVIYGHSMGSGVAVDLASRLPQSAYGGLILESAFSSFADVAAQAGFWASVAARFNDERFASIEKIGKVRAPLLMIHGDQDDTIPIVLGQRLFAVANAPKQWVQIDGGQHSDLHEAGQLTYQQALQSFKAVVLSQP